MMAVGILRDERDNHSYKAAIATPPTAPNVRTLLRDLGAMDEKRRSRPVIRIDFVSMGVPAHRQQPSVPSAAHTLPL